MFMPPMTLILVVPTGSTGIWNGDAGQAKL
jgi:hypothetical protein